jgi:chromate transporter
MAAHPSFCTALRFWLKLGLISFGGPAGQIALMQRELVERKQWIGQARFLHALNFCMLLPGPEAQQLAIYCGWLLHRTWGGIVAGALFVLPSALLLWGLSGVYVLYGNHPDVGAFLHGLKPAVVALVVAALLRIGPKALGQPAQGAIAAAAFGLIFFLHVPFPLIVVGAMAVGWAGGRLAPAVFASSPRGHGAADAGTGPSERPASADESPAGAVIDDAAECNAVRPSWGRTGRILTVGLTLWLAPVGLIGALLGWHSVWVHQAVFFSKAALVTFGGAYAVLPYVAQQAVTVHGWLSGPQMLDGLALAETTPGPLIIVLQFVGFLGGWNQPGVLSPLAAATLSAAITTWVTFVPCFLWIFLGAPHIERLRGQQGLAAILGAVTASVVGVIFNLAVWFGWQVLVPGGTWASVYFLAVGLGLAAFVALHRYRVSGIAVIAACGGVGLLAGWL